MMNLFLTLVVNVQLDISSPVNTPLCIPHAQGCFYVTSTHPSKLGNQLIQHCHLVHGPHLGVAYSLNYICFLPDPGSFPVSCVTFGSHVFNLKQFASLPFMSFTVFKEYSLIMFCVFCSLTLS